LKIGPEEVFELQKNDVVNWNTPTFYTQESDSLLITMT